MSEKSFVWDADVSLEEDEENIAKALVATVETYRKAKFTS
jgi:hypothetical protein